LTARKRLGFSTQFKFKVALEDERETKTLSEPASEHAVHPNRITRWKRQLLKEGAENFSHNPDHQQQKGQAVEAGLFERIGRLKMELERLEAKAPRPAGGTNSSTRGNEV
jgi:putative transposase